MGAGGTGKREKRRFLPDSDIQTCVLQAYFHLGINEKLGLSGRPDRPIGCLGTSKVLMRPPGEQGSGSGAADPLGIRSHASLYVLGPIL